MSSRRRTLAASLLILACIVILAVRATGTVPAPPLRQTVESTTDPSDPHRDTTTSPKTPHSFQHRLGLSSTGRPLSPGRVDLSAMLTNRGSISEPATDVFPMVAIGLTPSFSIAGGLRITPADIGGHVQITPTFHIGEYDGWQLSADARTSLTRQSALVMPARRLLRGSTSPLTHGLSRQPTWTLRSAPRLLITTTNGPLLGVIGVGLSLAAPGMDVARQVVPPDENGVALHLSLGGTLRLHPELSIVSENHLYHGLTAEADRGLGPWTTSVEAGRTKVHSLSGLRFSVGPYAIGAGLLLRDIPRWTNESAPSPTCG